MPEAWLKYFFRILNFSQMTKAAVFESSLCWNIVNYEIWIRLNKGLDS